MADLLCPICGRPNSEDREFCDFCGNPLDGALQVEEPSPRQDTSEPAGQDEISRLDSFFSDSASEIPEEQASLSQPSEPESRLESYLSQEEPPIQPEGSEPASRLDDYLPPQDEDRLPDQGPQGTSPPSQDEFSRLEEYLMEDQADAQLPSQPTADVDSRLDDFFQDDILDSPDPFQEPPSFEPESKAGSQTEQEPLDRLSERLSLPKELEDKLNGEEPEIEPEDPWDFLSAEPEDEKEGRAEDWDFLQEEVFSESPLGEEAPGSQDSGGSWDFPDFESLEEPGGETEAPVAETSPGEWDFLDPGLPADQPDELVQSSQTPHSEVEEPAAAFLDPERAGKQSAGPAAQSSPAEDDFDEWSFLDPGPAADQPVDPDRASQAPSSGAEQPTPAFPEAKGSEDHSAEPPAQAGSAEEGFDDWSFLDPGLGDEEEIERPAPVEEQPQGEFDWLDPGPAADQQEDESQLEFGSEGFGEDSGWLDMLQSPQSREASPEPEEPKIPQTDWLDKIKRLNKSSDLVDEDSSFPDWLAVSERPPSPAEAVEEPEPESASSEVPDWLKVEDQESLNEFLRKKDLTNEEYQPQISEPAPEAEKDLEKEDAPAAELSDSQQIKFPSWAGDEKKKAQKPPAGPAAEPFQIEEEYFDDLFSEELPDWLTTASSQEILPTPADNLAQGELPGWVEAMRPVVESSDASGLAGDEEYIENYGPLAGIPSVLPAEAEIGINLDEAAKKPLDLLATKSHQDYVNLLKKIIGNEDQSKAIQRAAPPQTQRVLRWLIAIVLLVTSAATVIFSDIVEPQPPSSTQIQGSGYAALYDEIETLYDGQPVLIAYDYQPATAGELQTAAATVVDHLMERGTYLSIISTQPTGPALAEHFLRTTQAEHGYLHSQKYVNLGYLPGNSAGLLSFMIAPKQIIPLAFNGSNAWDAPPLKGVDTIADFRMILVITDDPDTAKTWIEQVGTRLGGTPLTMVVSAQVEPLIQPYFRSSPRLLDGYVAGVIDSLNYEQISARPNQSSRIYLPFNIGIIISVGIIFIGGLANGVLSLFSHRKASLLGESQ